MKMIKNNKNTWIMKKENLTPEKIQEFNNKVEYNESAASWMIDIVATLIAWPMIILAIRRRAKYHEKIKLNNEEIPVEQ